MSPARRLPDDQVSPNTARQRKYRATEQGRYKDIIRSRTNHAIRTGLLVKQPCFCGNELVEAHHYAGYDLEHALDVAWMCKRHHELVHHPLADERRRHAS